MNHILTELSIDEQILIDNSGAQQLITISPTAPSTDDAPQENMDRVDAVKECIRREMETGKVTVDKEVIDAEFDFVSA